MPTSPTCAIGWPAPGGPMRETVDDWTQGIRSVLCARGLRVLAHVVRLAGPRGRAQSPSRSSARRSAAAATNRSGSTFIHARSPEPNALPLVLTHGWPGSTVEFMKVDRPTHRPGGPRRRPGRRVPCRRAVAARLRLQRQADPHRVGDGADRHRMGRADGPPRLRPLRSAGRRLGFGGDHPHRRAEPRPLRRHSRQHGRRVPWSR